MSNPKSRRKNAHAVALGRRGGRARAANLSADALSRIGKAAVAARERKRKAEKPQSQQD